MGRNIPEKYGFGESVDKAAIVGRFGKLGCVAICGAFFSIAFVCALC